MIMNNKGWLADNEGRLAELGPGASGRKVAVTVNLSIGCRSRKGGCRGVILPYSVWSNAPLRETPAWIALLNPGLPPSPSPGTDTR